MLRKTLLYTLFFLFCVTAIAEDFIVVKVSGTITADGKVVKPGDKLHTGQKLVYNSNEARAVVYSAKRGRLVLKKDATKEKSEFELTIASLTNPPRGQLSTRSGGINNIIDLKNHFSKGKYLLLDSTGIEINKNLFEVSEGEFFYLRYTYDDEEINKKLSSTRDEKNDNPVIILDKNEILQVDRKPIDFKEVSNVKLYHYNSKAEESVFISDIDLVAPNTDVLKYELQIILSGFENKESKKAKEEVKSYLTTEYGNPSKSNFEDWYTKNCL